MNRALMGLLLAALIAAAMPREKPPTRSQLVVRKMRNKLMIGPALRFFLGRPVARVAKPALQFAADPEGKVELLAKDADVMSLAAKMALNFSRAGSGTSDMMTTNTTAATAGPIQPPAARAGASSKNMVDSPFQLES